MVWYSIQLQFQFKRKGNSKKIIDDGKDMKLAIYCNCIWPYYECIVCYNQDNLFGGKKSEKSGKHYCVYKNISSMVQATITFLYTDFNRIK